MCESMKWAHLPVAGGLYDQHPDLLNGFSAIFSARNKFEAEEQDRQERKQKEQARQNKNRSGRRR